MAVQKITKSLNIRAVGWPVDPPVYMQFSAEGKLRLPLRMTKGEG